jgi:hypothetical protein
LIIARDDSSTFHVNTCSHSFRKHHHGNSGYIPASGFLDEKYKNRYQVFIVKDISRNALYYKNVEGQ